MKMRLVLFQCFLCFILLTGLILIKTRENSESLPAGTFGTQAFSNDTLCDLCDRVYREIFE